MPYPSKKFRQNPFTTSAVIRRTDRQTEVKTSPPSLAEVIKHSDASDAEYQQEWQETEKAADIYRVHISDSTNRLLSISVH